MDDIIGNKFYLVFIAIFTFIVYSNYKNLKNPRPYPPKKIIEEFKKGKFSLSSYKYRGFSYYSLPRLVKSESNWVDGFKYWNKACIRLGIIGIIITFIIMILGEIFNLYNSLIGVVIILSFLILSMIFISCKMEKNILKD